MEIHWEGLGYECDGKEGESKKEGEKEKKKSGDGRELACRRID